MKYIWQAPDWPRYRWDWQALSSGLSACRQAQGFLKGRLVILGLSEKETSRGHVMVEEALQTSAIEGEKLDIEVGDFLREAAHHSDFEVLDDDGATGLIVEHRNFLPQLLNSCGFISEI